MRSQLASRLFTSRAGLLVASGAVVVASTTAGIVLSLQSNSHHTGVLGEKITKSPTGTNGGSGTPSGTNSTSGTGTTTPATSANAFSMTVEALGTVGPGERQTLNVTVSNPNGQNMQITGATGVVNSVNKPGCLPAWFTVEDWTPGTSPTIAPANGSTVIQMTLDFLDLPTNQDVCKSTPGSPVTISFTLHATGAQA